MSEKFNWGKPEQNFVMMPKSLIDALPMIDSGAELKVILYVLRHTWGYNEYEEGKQISIDEFMNGRKRLDGTRIDGGVGMSENAVKDGIRRAVEHGFIVVEADDKDLARKKRFYMLASGGEEAGGSTLEGQKLTLGGSEVDPLPSKVDPRTERNTNRDTPEKKICADDFQNQNSYFGLPVRQRRNFGNQIDEKVAKARTFGVEPKEFVALSDKILEWRGLSNFEVSDLELNEAKDCVLGLLAVDAKYGEPEGIDDLKKTHALVHHYMKVPPSFGGILTFAKQLKSGSVKVPMNTTVAQKDYTIVLTDRDEGFTPEEIARYKALEEWP